MDGSIPSGAGRGAIDGSGAGRGATDGSIPSGADRGATDGSIPSGAGRGAIDGSIPNGAGRGATDGSIPSGVGRGANDGSIPSGAGTGGSGTKSASSALRLPSGLALCMNAGILCYKIELADQQQQPQKKKKKGRRQDKHQQGPSRVQEVCGIPAKQLAIYCILLSWLVELVPQTRLWRLAGFTAPVLLRLLVHLLEHHPGEIYTRSLVRSLLRRNKGEEECKLYRCSKGSRCIVVAALWLGSLILEAVWSWIMFGRSSGYAM